MIRTISKGAAALEVPACAHDTSSLIGAVVNDGAFDVAPAVCVAARSVAQAGRVAQWHVTHCHNRRAPSMVDLEGIEPSTP